MSAGGPMITAATARTLGFLVFGLSSFRPVSNFGLLSGFIMVVNLIADLFLLPTLMLLTGRKTVEKIPTEEE
jgi:predicted RND superfamily exporter protein